MIRKIHSLKIKTNNEIKNKNRQEGVFINIYTLNRKKGMSSDKMPYGWGG